MARSITMRSPLTVEEVTLPDGSVGYATDGTPVDCVRLGVLGFLDRPPDLIVSGINLGGNLGDDITYSGTVAAAFEGIMLDIPAIAVSAEDFHPGYDLSVPAQFVAQLVEEMLDHGPPPGTLLNVNCPDRSWDDLRGVRVTTLGKRIYGDKVELHDAEGGHRRYLIYGDDLSYHEEEGTDFEAVGDGFISITPLHFSLTAYDVIEQIAEWDLAPRPPRTAPKRPPVVHRVQLSPLRPRPRAVVFDLDGTLFDSVELIVGSFAHAVKDVLGIELPREELIRNVGRPLLEQMRLLDEFRAEELVRSYREYNHREHDRMTRLYPQMADLLERLREAEIPLGLVTSKSRATTQMAFRLTGIESFFAATVCAEDTERNKPDPEPLLHAAAILDILAPEGVYVGDSPYDIQAARAAGMRSVGVTWGVFPIDAVEQELPDRLVDTPQELARVVGVRL